jgi:hypothetical protein
MADFINTIDLLGDAVTAEAIINKTITEFSDDILTSIGRYAFMSCSKLTSVDLPNVTSIDSSAFDSCKVLTSVDLPNVTSIGSSAFDSCQVLTSVRLPATPPTLANVNAFRNINSACKFYIPTGSLSAYQSATNWSSLTSTYSFVEENR